MYDIPLPFCIAEGAGYEFSKSEIYILALSCILGFKCVSSFCFSVSINFYLFVEKTNGLVSI